MQTPRLLLPFSHGIDMLEAESKHLRVFFMDRLQRRECFVNMSLRSELREEDVTDNSLSVDDVRYAPWQSECCGYSIAFSDDAIHIAQQVKWELVFAGELPMRLHRI
jgi:hypothetical protein